MFFFHEHRGIITLRGPDRKQFLQGLITNDIHCGPCIYTAHLSPQGRFQQEFFIVDQDETLFLTVEKERLPGFLQKLQMYKLRADVTIDDQSDQYALISGWSDHPLDYPWHMDPRHPDLEYIGIIKKSEMPSLSSWEIYAEKRISLGVPNGEADIKADKGIILECNFDELHGIAWSKGCYTGQELMSRTKHTGAIRKRLLPIYTENGNFAPDSILFFQGERAGDIRSTQGNLGLALLRLEYVQRSIKLAIPITDEYGNKVIVSIPPYLKHTVEI